jgi:hypothetical protein
MNEENKLFVSSESIIYGNYNIADCIVTGAQFNINIPTECCHVCIKQKQEFENVLKQMNDEIEKLKLRMMMLEQQIISS